MDVITFIIIAIFVYSIFSKKNKPPQRGQLPSKPTEDTQTTRKKKEGIFENIERQIRESAENLEKELQGGRTIEKQKVPQTPVYKPFLENRTSSDTQVSRDKSGDEGVRGDEGRSDYDKYVSVQGTQGVEGAGGGKSSAVEEGTWGSEGREYGNVQAREKYPVEQAGIGATSIFPEPRAAGSLKFSSSSIIDGVIWSEVLKEPRGKRAFNGR